MGTNAQADARGQAGRLKTFGENRNRFAVQICGPLECTPMPEISAGRAHPMKGNA